MRSLMSACALSALIAIPAAAQEAPAPADSPPASPTSQIVVTGRGLADTPATPAYSVQEIDRDRLLIAASGRIEDALSAAAGFQQFRRSDSRSSNPSAQGVTLRALGGNATSRTLVLLDGVPMADPFFGYIPLSAIAPERLASARVIRGGGSGAFGAGAVAGTIDLTSAGADQLGLLNASAMVDDRGETELSGTLAPKLGEGFAVVSGRWDRGQGFWTTPDSQRVPASVRARYDSWSAGIRAVAPLAPGIELQARVAAFEDNRTLRFKGADTGMSGQDASLRLVGRGAWQFDVLGYLQSRDFNNRVISATTFLPTLDQRKTPSTGAGGKIEVRPPVGGGHALKLGADWRSAEGHTIEDTYRFGALSGHRKAGGTNSDVGLFIEDDWSVGPLVLTAGARADRWSVRSGTFQSANLAGAVTSDIAYPDRSGWDGSFRGGAVVHAAKSVDLRLAAYTGLRQPTLNELYRAFTVFPITTLANAALQNEKLRGFEGGIDLRLLPGVTLSATAFDNRVRDAIANVTINATTRERQNVDAVQSRGIELAGAVAAGAFSLGGSFSYTDAEVQAPGQALDGKRPSQTPRWAASATASWRPADRWTLALTLRHVGAQFEDDLETDVLPPATTIDAFAQVPLGSVFSLVLRGENLTDETVVTRNSGGSMDWGAPRTLWAGLRVEIR
ncbi:TonB-dependent receptor [Novosphingobium sp. KCTC 2891]|uniref:TonB-dependent receptor n=1 Tax=Novosphingobium sp. KCTC 2891 TaxID=2989730 RepID=UPI00222398E2|nr:TonB-dependent receptor [Novosphingobium sp. KCTC 2891]MCW1381395.1 TonB-dependent receptor [Novosphingobium sp. KCTC 2891]